MQGQVYVEVLAPKDVKRPYPLVLIHGAGQTATNWMNTPDGRKGWAEYFVEQGYVVYMIDQPMRGRSATHPGDGATRMFTAANEQFQFTAIETDGTWPGREKETQWPGDGPNKGKKGDPVFDYYAKMEVNGVSGFNLEGKDTLDDLVQLLNMIGKPVILLLHSGSSVGWLVADSRPQLVRAILAPEPNSPPIVSAERGSTGPGNVW